MGRGRERDGTQEVAVVAGRCGGVVPVMQVKVRVVSNGWLDIHIVFNTTIDLVIPQSFGPLTKGKL